MWQVAARSCRPRGVRYLRGVVLDRMSRVKGVGSMRLDTGDYAGTGTEAREMMSYRVSGDCGCELCAITVALKRGYDIRSIRSGKSDEIILLRAAINFRKRQYNRLTV